MYFYVARFSSEGKLFVRVDICWTVHVAQVGGTKSVFKDTI
jgi:hypothetical protein